MVLHQHATDCKLGDLTDSLVKDVLIIGTKDFHLWDHLLREHDFTLDQTIQAGQTAEETRSKAKVLERTET